VADGKLALNDSPRKYLDGAPDAWQPITIAQLMSHTAGLVRESPAFEFLKQQPDAELIRAAYNVPLNAPPGTKWDYSNLGYFMLAEIIHRVSGKPWPDFLQDRLFKPLDMRATR